MPYVFIQQMLVEHVPACLCQGGVLHSCDGAGADPPQAFGCLSVALPSSGSVPRGREMQSSWGRFCRAVQAFQLHPLTCDPGHISNVSRPQLLICHGRGRDTQLHRVLAGVRVPWGDVTATAAVHWTRGRGRVTCGPRLGSIDTSLATDHDSWPK